MYLPAEIEVTFGRVLKIMYETCLETQTSATVLMMSYSVESGVWAEGGGCHDEDCVDVGQGL